MRQALAKVGYRFSGEQLPAFMSDCFLIIASEYGKQEAETIKKQKQKNRIKRGR